MPEKTKREVVTFKVDMALSQAMRGIANRSEFIRSAIMAALEGVCPLCRGTGTLTANQHRHWETFSENHSLEECGTCRALHLVCETRR